MREKMDYLPQPVHGGSKRIVKRNNLDASPCCIFTSVCIGYLSLLKKTNKKMSVLAEKVNIS